MSTDEREEDRKLSHTIHVVIFDQTDQAQRAQFTVQDLTGRFGSNGLETLEVIRDRLGRVWLHDLHPLPAEPWCMDGKILRLIVGLIFNGDCHGVLWGIVMAELRVGLIALGFEHRQMETIYARLKPNTSALFVLAPDSARPPDGLPRLLDQFPGEYFQIVLDLPVEAFLKQILGDLHQTGGSLAITSSITTAAAAQLVKARRRRSPPV